MPMPADPPRELHPTGADLGSLFPTIQQLAETMELTAPVSPEARRARLREALRYNPPLVNPEAEVLARVDYGEYIRERVEFTTAPGIRVPAYVLIPKDLTAPAPGIVDLHSHGGMFLFGKEKVLDLGDNHPAMTAYHAENYGGRPTATELVRRGYVVITIDALMFGERRAMLDADLAYGWDRSRYSLEDVEHLNAHCRAKESTLVKALTFAGTTWPGVVCWDDMRTVDYLLSRPEVDPAHIGCVGVSMGGYRAMLLGAIDTRIRATCVVGFMSTVRSMLRAHLDTHSWVHFLPTVHRYLDWPEMAALAAPRALLVLQCARDGLFSREGMEAAVARIAELYAEASPQFAGRFYDAPHQFSLEMQEDAFAWFEAILGVH